MEPERPAEAELLGRVVRIDGLVSAEGQKLNGLTGVVRGFAAGRFHVQVGEDQHLHALKPTNCEVQPERPERAFEHEREREAPQMHRPEHEASRFEEADSGQDLKPRRDPSPSDVSTRPSNDDPSPYSEALPEAGFEVSESSVHSESRRSVQSESRESRESARTTPTPEVEIDLNPTGRDSLRRSRPRASCTPSPRATRSWSPSSAMTRSTSSPRTAHTSTTSCCC